VMLRVACGDVQPTEEALASLVISLRARGFLLVRMQRFLPCA
jgi:hypothetical protein